MAQRRPHQSRPSRGHRNAAPAPIAPRPVFQRPPPKRYGPPFVLLEDEAKQTFEFIGGSWVPYSLSIAECRAGGEVTQLAQKVNKMTRYQIRLEISA